MDTHEHLSAHEHPWTHMNSCFSKYNAAGKLLVEPCVSQFLNFLFWVVGYVSFWFNCSFLELNINSIFMFYFFVLSCGGFAPRKIFADFCKTWFVIFILLKLYSFYLFIYLFKYIYIYTYICICMYIYIYIFASVYIYVCVEHLKRCKTSNSRNVCIGWFLFLLFSGQLPSLHLLDAGGRGIQSGTTSNEATWLYGRQSLISSAYLLQFSTVYGDRLSQVPACRFSNLFSNQTTVRFSQSDWAASEPVNPSSKDVERFPSHSFSLLIIQPFLSGLLRCFCTYDAFHINNSISYVSFIPIFVKMVWTLRGKPF